MKVQIYNGKEWVEISRDGKTPIKGVDYFDGVDGAPGAQGEKGEPGDILNIAALGTATRDGLELLHGDDRLDKSAVKGIDELEKRLDERIASIPRGGGGGRASHSTKFYALTADGSTKTFTVPKSVSSIVLTSDFPHILFENSGFTTNATRTQITLTTDNAPSNGAQLLYQFQEVFNT